MNDLETSVFGGAIIAVVVLAFVIVLMYLVPLRLWIAAWSSGAYVGLVTLIGMRLRRVPPGPTTSSDCPARWGRPPERGG